MGFLKLPLLLFLVYVSSICDAIEPSVGIIFFSLLEFSWILGLFSNSVDNENLIYLSLLPFKSLFFILYCFTTHDYYKYSIQISVNGNLSS